MAAVAVPLRTKVAVPYSVFTTRLPVRSPAAVGANKRSKAHSPSMSPEQFPVATKSPTTETLSITMVEKACPQDGSIGGLMIRLFAADVVPCRCASKRRPPSRPSRFTPCDKASDNEGPPTEPPDPGTPAFGCRSLAKGGGVGGVRFRGGKSGGSTNPGGWQSIFGNCPKFPSRLPSCPDKLSPNPPSDRSGRTKIANAPPADTALTPCLAADGRVTHDVVPQKSQ